MQQCVALKVLFSRASKGGQELERFLREARAAGRLHHTNIVPVFVVDVENGQHFYAMTGRREASLDALKEAAKILPTLGLSAADFDLQRLRLRNEAGAVFGKTDIMTDPSRSQGSVSSGLEYDFDYARDAISRQRIEFRRAANDELLKEIPQYELPATDLRFSRDGRFDCSIIAKHLARWPFGKHRCGSRNCILIRGHELLSSNPVSPFTD